MSEFVQAIISGISIGLIYTLLGLGFVLIYKASQVFNLAQGELLLLNAFICYACLSQLHLPPVPAILATLAVATIIGIIINRLFITRLIGQPIIATIMITIVLALLLRGLVFGIWLGNPEPLGISIVGALHLGDFTVGLHHMYFFAVAIVVFAFLAVFLRTKTGLALRAVAEEHQVAQATGIKVPRVFDVVWIGASLAAAICGILIAASYGVHYGLYMYGFKAFPVVILGGMDSILGVLIAGPIIGIVETLAIQHLDPILGGGAGELIPYVVLLLVLLFKPYGLMGLRRIERI